MLSDLYRSTILHFLSFHRNVRAISANTFLKHPFLEHPYVLDVPHTELNLTSLEHGRQQRSL